MVEEQNKAKKAPPGVKRTKNLRSKNQAKKPSPKPKKNKPKKGRPQIEKQGVKNFPKRYGRRGGTAKPRQNLPEPNKPNSKNCQQGSCQPEQPPQPTQPAQPWETVESKDRQPLRPKQIPRRFGFSCEFYSS